MSTLLKLTKAQLIDLVKDRNAEVQALRMELSISKAPRAASPAVKPANTGRWNTKPATSTAWARPAWMEAARAKAMATGSVVLA